MIRKCNLVLKAIFVLGGFSTGVQAADIDWSGSGRVYHQRWSFGDGETSVDRQREKVDFFLNGETQLSHGVKAQIRFRHYSLDFQDKVDAFQLNRANITWHYGEGNFLKIGLMGVEDVTIGDHMRAYYNHRMGMAWRHHMNLGPGSLFMGFSRIALGDAAKGSITDQTTYYTPQAGYKMTMGDYHLLVGGTYHLYSSLNPYDFKKGYVVLGRKDENRGDYAGLEFFGKLAGKSGPLGWHVKYAMFSNGEAPENAVDSMPKTDESEAVSAIATKDEDKMVTLMGFGLDYGKVSLMMEMSNSGTYGVNRAVVNKDWCGNNVGASGGKSTCDSMKFSLTYKLSDNLMPKLEFVQAERNNDGLAQSVIDGNASLKDEKFMMTRLAINFKF